MSALDLAPPAIARRILATTLDNGSRTDVLANLDELYRRRHAEHGRWAAAGWYWRQALTFRFAMLRSRRPAAGPPPGGNTPKGGVSVWSDLRYAGRALRRSPSYTVAAVLTLALGFGANFSIFAVVNTVVLRPLPFPEPDRLVWVWPSGQIALTLQRFTELREPVAPVATLTAFAGRAFAIVGGDAPDEVTGIAVSANHFDVFGTPPALGRGFRPEDAIPGAEPRAVISHELWQTRFAGDSSVIGRRVDLYTAAVIPMIPGAFSGTAHTVIGVAAPRYRPFGGPVSVFTPLVVDASDPNYANMGELFVVGRLATRSTPSRVREELVRLTAVMPSMQSIRDAAAGDDVIPLQDALVGSVRPTLWITAGAVGLVLLIACANVANLNLVRSQSRRRELAVRHALGARRGTLARQIVVESCVVSTMAAALGGVGTLLIMPAVRRSLPSQIVGGDLVDLHGGVFLFAFAALAVAGVAAGAAPAVRATARSALDLGSIHRDARPRRRTHLMNQGLVVAEIALALVLAYGAGLLLKSFARLADEDIGFNTEYLMTVRVAPSERKYGDADVRRDLFRRVLDDMRALPGVASAGAIHFLPVADGGPGINFLPDPTDPESRTSSGYRVVTPEYRATMDIPLLAGRDLKGDDGANAPPAGLVNRALAERLWPDAPAVGQTLYRTNGRAFFRVVGVVGNVRQAALGLPPQPEIYIPLAQSAWASAMTVVVRTNGNVPGISEQLQAITRAADPDVPITRVASMRSLVDASVTTQRFYVGLFSSFAILALALGGVGVYGVVAYVVGHRRDEIGIRLALGATQSAIARHEYRRGAIVAGIGLGVGIVLAGTVTRVMSGLLYQVSPVDIPIFVATATVLLGVTGLAIVLPVRRAARLDPTEAMRVTGR